MEKDNPDTRPVFLRIMLFQNLTELDIPLEFFNDHLAGEEAERVTLRGPCGSYDVKLEQRNGDVYLVHGWQDFVKAHSMGALEIIIFLYNGDKSFDVTIYGKNCLEKNYATSSRLESVASFTSSFPSFRHKIKSYTVGSKGTLLIPKAFTRRNLPMIRQPMELRDSDGISWATNVIVTTNRHLSLTKGWKAFADAHSLKKGDVCIFELVEQNLMDGLDKFRVGPAIILLEGFYVVEMEKDNPDTRPVFLRIMLFQNLTELDIPLEFFNDHLAGREAERVTLRGPCGSYHVELEQRNGNVYLVHGWQDFVKAHSLGALEIIIFLYNGDTSFDVTIYGKNCLEKNYATPSPLESAASFTSPFPSFRHKIKSYNVGSKCTLLIPKAFTRRNLPMIRQPMELRDSDGMSWETNVIVTKNDHLSLSKGWKAFADAHSLKKGDVCIFELVKQNLMNVSIQRN